MKPEIALEHELESLVEAIPAEKIQQAGMTRRQLLVGSASLAATVAFSNRIGTPIVPEVTRHQVRMPGLKSPLRVVQLSDLHRSWCVSDWFIAQAVDMANAENPDIMALTGDFVTRQGGYAVSCAEQLKRLTPKIGSYAVPGNHDYWCDDSTGMPFVAEALASANIPMLVNKTVVIEEAGLWLIGLDDVWVGGPDPSLVSTGTPSGVPKLVLSHNPNIFPMVYDQNCTVLTGHTHGGQINIPGIGQRLIGKFPYLKGWYPGKAPESRIYVSRGLGTVKIPLRINASPEIAVFDLVPA